MSEYHRRDAWQGVRDSVVGVGAAGLAVWYDLGLAVKWGVRFGWMSAVNKDNKFMGNL